MPPRACLAALLLLLAACSKAPTAPLKAAEAPAAAQKVVLFLGDSLTAGYGVLPEEAFPALIGRAFKERGLPYAVRNAGVSGRTSAGLLENLDWSLSPDVRLAFLCIGANDALRGLPTEQAEANIAAAIEKIQAKGIRVVLAGMKVPPNYGEDYARRFAAIYPKLAQRYRLKLLPFLLQDVGGVSKLNQADGLHPNAQGHRLIAKNVLKFFEKEKVLP